jgi:hypothetical protein
MRERFNQLPRLKLKNIDAGTFIVDARDVLEKRSIFFYYILFRCGVAVATPLVCGLSLMFYQYLEKGGADKAFVVAGVMAMSIVETGLSLMVFFALTKRLRSLFDSLVHRRVIVGDDVVSAMHESFKLPLRLVVAEFSLMALVFMAPLLLNETFGVRPLGISLSQVLLAWWLGALTLM